MAREARTSHRRHRSPPSASSEKFLSGLARQVPARRAWTAAGSLEPSVLGLAGEARRPQEGTGAASAEKRGWAHPRAKRGLGRETQDVRAAEEPRRWAGGQAARPRVARPQVDARRVEGHSASLGPRGLGRNVLLEVTPISGRPGKQRGLLIPDRNDTDGAEGVAWAPGNEKSTLG